MARIRTIKPEFPQSETMGRLSRDARLLFVLLWTIVDDAGRARAASRMLASLLFPYDDDAPGCIDAWLAELESEGCIRRYTVDGSYFLDLPNWLKHQKIDRPSDSKLPPFPADIANNREPSREFDADLGPRKGPRKGNEAASAASSAGAAREPAMPRADYDALEARLRDAARLTDDPSPGLMSLAPILGLLDGGASLEADILPVLRAKAAAGKRGRSWAFYVDAVRDAMTSRSAAANVVPISATPSRETPRDVWAIWVAGFKQKRSWLHALGPKPDEAGCRAPPEILAEHGFQLIDQKETA